MEEFKLILNYYISVCGSYNVSDCSTTSCVFDFLLRCTPL